MLVVVDSENAPAVSPAQTAETTRLVIAGEPDGCSGKSNAVAAGLEAATDPIIILTDDDVPREADWLETVKSGVNQHGAVSGAPLYTHQHGSGRPLAWLYEPAQALGSLLLLLGNGVWGGAAGFHRKHIDDMDALVADLRRTVTDDLLVGEHLTTDRQADTDLATTIPVDVTVNEFLDRMVRYTLTFRYSDEASLGLLFLLGGFQLGALLLAPLFTVPAMVLGGLCVYWVFGAARATVLFAPVSLIVNALLTAYAMQRSEFEWGGRRYRWRDKFEVEIVRE